VRVAFFGLPLAGVLLARDGHEIAYAGICRAALGLRRLKRLAGPSRVHFLPDTGAARTAALVAEARPELIVSWFWTKKLPAQILGIAPAVGIHPSLLPRHRGPDPYFWTIDAGDATTGVTAHRLDEDYDTGPILGQSSLSIAPGWNSWQLARALDRPSLQLLRATVRAFAEGKPPEGKAQDEALATSAPEPDDDELAIRWSWTADRIERRVRAAAPWPGAWTEIGEHVVTLVRVRQTGDFPRALEPGEAAVRAGVAVVRAGAGALELLEGRDDSGAFVGTRALAELVEEARGAAGTASAE
jgi:methionyl-tRNA formyltransferase